MSPHLFPFFSPSALIDWLSTALKQNCSPSETEQALLTFSVKHRLKLTVKTWAETQCFHNLMSQAYKQPVCVEVHLENKNVLFDLFPASHSICSPPQWWACFSRVCLLCRGRLNHSELCVHRLLDIRKPQGGLFGQEALWALSTVWLSVDFNENKQTWSKRSVLFSLLNCMSIILTSSRIALN